MLFKCHRLRKVAQSATFDLCRVSGRTARYPACTELPCRLLCDLHSACSPSDSGFILTETYENRANRVYVSIEHHDISSCAPQNVPFCYQEVRWRLEWLFPCTWNAISALSFEIFSALRSIVGKVGNSLLEQSRRNSSSYFSSVPRGPTRPPGPRDGTGLL
ncbi:hypothetical protein CPB85DRAFT_749043 [Mucidula mucida]|nr:hypothetical protein CPB85DRAFT_749043 [Mucidula mucida]